MKFPSKYINTTNHCLLGTSWPFRGCEVKMHSDGFDCNCQKRPRIKCTHINSVELGILGVSYKEFKIESVCA